MGYKVLVFFEMKALDHGAGFDGRLSETKILL